MRRKDFLFQSSLLAGLGLLPGNLSATPTPPIAPVLLLPLPPLDHQGAMAIRTIIRSEMTGGVYSNVETAVAPKIMGPPPHWHKELDELTLENGFADGSDAKNRELAKLNEEYGLVFPENAFSRYDEIKAQFGLK
jgi:hypothetical protein